MSPVSNVKTITQECRGITAVSSGQTGERSAFYTVNQCWRDHPPAVAFLHSIQQKCNEGLLLPSTGKCDVPPAASHKGCLPTSGNNTFAHLTSGTEAAVHFMPHLPSVAVPQSLQELEGKGEHTWMVLGLECARCLPQRTNGYVRWSLSTASCWKEFSWGIDTRKGNCSGFPFVQKLFNTSPTGHASLCYSNCLHTTAPTCRGPASTKI